MTPEDLKYTKQHEWVRVEGNVATVGITDHAQQELGDITFVELPEVGKEFAQRAEMGAIESVKAASDVYAPVAGTIAEVNSKLDDAPEMINEEPYGKGWICRLSDIDVAGLDALMDAAAYETHIG